MQSTFNARFASFRPTGSVIIFSWLSLASRETAPENLATGLLKFCGMDFTQGASERKFCGLDHKCLTGIVHILAQR